MKTFISETDVMIMCSDKEMSEKPEKLGSFFFSNYENAYKTIVKPYSLKGPFH